MTAKECIYGRRSIRKYKPDPVDHALLESVIEARTRSDVTVPLFSQIMVKLLKMHHF